MFCFETNNIASRCLFGGLLMSGLIIDWLVLCIMLWLNLMID